MLIFLDTEFTGSKPYPELISIALVSEDGQHEFYAELAEGWTDADCSEFVRREVLPLLKGNEYRTTRSELRERLAEWFASIPCSCKVACDAGIDYVLLRGVLAGCWPTNLGENWFDLRPMVNTAVFDKAARGFYDVHKQPHNALADAHANWMGWLAWFTQGNR